MLVSPYTYHMINMTDKSFLILCVSVIFTICRTTISSCLCRWLSKVPSKAAVFGPVGPPTLHHHHSVANFYKLLKQNSVCQRLLSSIVSLNILSPLCLKFQKSFLLPVPVCWKKLAAKPTTQQRLLVLKGSVDSCFFQPDNNTCFYRRQHKNGKH